MRTVIILILIGSILGWVLYYFILDEEKRKELFNPPSQQETPTPERREIQGLDPQYYPGLQEPIPVDSRQDKMTSMVPFPRKTLEVLCVLPLTEVHSTLRQDKGSVPGAVRLIVLSQAKA